MTGIEALSSEERTDRDTLVVFLEKNRIKFIFLLVWILLVLPGL